MAKHDLNLDTFAKELGCTRVHLGAVVNGKRQAGTTLAKLIECKTNGEIKEKDVLEAYEKDVKEKP